MRMRAKFRVQKVGKTEHSEELTMVPVGANSYDKDGKNEDNDFARYTPSGKLEMSVTNPELAGTIAPGQEFYVDFTPVPAT